MGGSWKTEAARNIWHSVLHLKLELSDNALKTIRNFLRFLPSTCDTVKCHYELSTKTNVPGIQKDIFHCNLKYRGKSWFDWMMVTYSKAGSGGVLNESVTPARIFLWMTYKVDANAPIDVVALIRSLNSYDTP